MNQMFSPEYTSDVYATRFEEFCHEMGHEITLEHLPEHVRAMRSYSLSPAALLFLEDTFMSTPAQFRPFVKARLSADLGIQDTLARTFVGRWWASRTRMEAMGGKLVVHGNRKTKEQKRALLNAFFDRTGKDYGVFPSKVGLEALAQETELSTAQVRHWFEYMRKKGLSAAGAQASPP
ncbi:hypothetical protein BDR26DRAFT_917018 [Obelidium mucronatum]|nr:hypothetical protein BDR26DRAFT_917018 [Obelidium mucronatum]